MKKSVKISLLILLAVCFIVLAVLTVGGHMAGVNESVGSAVRALRTPWLTRAVTVLTHIGEWYVYVPIALLLIILPRFRLRVGLPVGGTLAVSAGLNALMKICLRVDRPIGFRLVEVSGYSFPSGHAMNGMAFISVCVGLFRRYSRNKAATIAVSVLGGLFVLAMGFSRIYLGVHTFADVLAGYSLGAFVSLLALTVTEKK